MNPAHKQIALTCWEMQDQGKTYSEIALKTWPMWLGTLSLKSKDKMLKRIKTAPEGPERDKVIVQWLKGTLDSVVLAVGKMGLRDQFLAADNRFTQSRCMELMRAKKQDEPNWSKETGGVEFNKVLARMDREDNVQGQVVKSLSVTKECRVSTITFGGRQFWTAKVGEKFPYDVLLERNNGYTVVQSGLNIYVFETACL